MDNSERLTANKTAVEVLFHGLRSQKKGRVLPGEDKLMEAIRERARKDQISS